MKSDRAPEPDPETPEEIYLDVCIIILIIIIISSSSSSSIIIFIISSLLSPKGLMNREIDSYPLRENKQFTISRNMVLSLLIYLYMYYVLYMHVYICVYIYIYIYIYVLPCATSCLIRIPSQDNKLKPKSSSKTWRSSGVAYSRFG